MTTIGVFDSGMGGLTVLRALRENLPNEQFVYLGDTARLPYGTKDPETVRRYALQAARVLVERGGVDVLVIACNTASSVALDVLARAFDPLPVFGVVEPGAAAAAVHATPRTGRVLVLATEGTVSNGAYVRALLRCDARLRVWSVPCQVLVALAEEGIVDEALARRVLDHYVGRFTSAKKAVDSVLLGCTHFPVFRRTLADMFDAATAIVDSADTTAAVVARHLHPDARDTPRAVTPDVSTPLRDAGHNTLFMVTDGVERFRRVAPVFFGAGVQAVECVNL